MSTPKEANRRNAQRSSGPRSAAGKAASSANSLKTGLYARSQGIAGEDPAELRALADQYFLRWQPATPEESFLVATLIDAEWLLCRYSLADAKIWDYKGANEDVRDDPNGLGLNFIRCRDYFPLLQRRADSALRAFHRALRDLERLQAKPAPPPRSPPKTRLPNPRRKPKPISPNSNRLNRKLGSFLHFAPLATPIALSPCRPRLRLTRRLSQRVPSRRYLNLRGIAPRKPRKPVPGASVSRGFSHSQPSSAE